MKRGSDPQSKKPKKISGKNPFPKTRPIPEHGFVFQKKSEIEIWLGDLMV
jgi:hypothetical protein